MDMQDFSGSVGSDGIRDDLLRAIHGAGAFRNFKDTVRRVGIESAWFAFRTNALRQIALARRKSDRLGVGSRGDTLQTPPAMLTSWVGLGLLP